MAEKNINDNKNNQSSGSNPFNSLKGKDGKPKFNFYWIYGIGPLSAASITLAPCPLTSLITGTILVA